MDEDKKKHSGRIAVEGKVSSNRIFGSVPNSYTTLKTCDVRVRVLLGTTKMNVPSHQMIITGIFSPPDVCCVSPSRTFHTNVVK